MLHFSDAINNISDNEFKKERYYVKIMKTRQDYLMNCYEIQEHLRKVS